MYRITTLFSGPLVQGGGINQLYFDQGGGTGADAHSAVVAFWGEVDGWMQGGLQYTVEGEIELVDNITGQVESVETTDAVSGVGSVGGDALPPANQALIRWRTGVFNGGREIRGRTFIPGIAMAASVSGVPTSELRNTLNTAAGNLIGDPDSELVVWSRKGTFATVTSGSAWNKFATLRSRRD